ncbi:hypothetical protein MRB53_039769 [Persea americana]|nr:hypothetical protein MRB53_039769 [Persea americana]
MPGYRAARTLVVLMGVARIGELVTALVSDTAVVGTQRDGEKYPPFLPIAVIERASSRDQRCLLSTLDTVEAAIDRVGDQRPPGMLVIGWSCLALQGDGKFEQDEDTARKRIGLYKVTEGIGQEWMQFLDEMMVGA